MKYLIDVSGMADGLDGTAYGAGDIVFADGKMVSRSLIVLSNGHVHGGDKGVITYLATSKDPAPTAWRQRENAGTL